MLGPVKSRFLRKNSLANSYVTRVKKLSAEVKPQNSRTYISFERLLGDFKFILLNSRTYISFERLLGDFKFILLKRLYGPAGVDYAYNLASVSACLCYKLRVYPLSYAIRTKFTKPCRYLIGYLKSCGYQLYCSIFTSLVYFTDG